ELQEIIDERLFIEFLNKSHRGVENKTDEQRKKIILNLTKKNADSKFVLEIAEKWSKGFSRDKDQMGFKCEIFNISKPDIVKNSISVSWAINPNFEIVDIKDVTEFLEERIALYEKEFGIDQAKTFLAIGDNGNYFGGVFGNLI